MELGEKSTTQNVVCRKVLDRFHSCHRETLFFVPGCHDTEGWKDGGGLFCDAYKPRGICFRNRVENAETTVPIIISRKNAEIGYKTKILFF